MTGNHKQGLLFWGGMALCVLLTVYVLRFHFTADIQPWGDYAADLLLTRKITEDGYLLTGHYSRFGFNHPGPFFFYLNHMMQVLLTRIGASTYGSLVLATTLFNNGCLFLAVWLLSQQWPQCTATVKLAVAAILMALFAGDALNLWMPYRLVLPFMAFSAALMLVLQGRFVYLPVAALLACILIHGYVTLPLIVLPPLALAIAAQVLRRRGRLLRAELKWLAIAAVICGIFVLPIVLDALLQERGNLYRIKASMLANPTHAFDAAATLNILVGFWHMHIFALCCAGVICLLSVVASRRLPPVAPFAAYATTWLAVSTLFLLLHAVTPGPFYEFVGFYYRGIVLALVALLWFAALQVIRHPGAKNAVAAVLMAMALALYVSGDRPVPPNAVHLKAISNALALAQAGTVRIDFREHAMFADAAGIVYNLREAGIDACVTRPAMAHIFTDNATCKTGLADFMVVYDTQCSDDVCWYRAPPLAVIKLSRQPFPRSELTR